MKFEIGELVKVSSFSTNSDDHFGVFVGYSSPRNYTVIIYKNNRARITNPELDRVREVKPEEVTETLNSDEPFSLAPILSISYYFSDKSGEKS